VIGFFVFHGKLLVLADVNFGGENLAAAALPPDMWKGFAFPKALLDNHGNAANGLWAQPSSTSNNPEGQRPSAHQAA
jgi:hypothetical protein